jgi:hypothetical protein
MATTSILGDGCKIGYETGSPLAFALIPELDSISAFPLPKWDKLENTKHGSGGYRTYGFGLGAVDDFSSVHYFSAGNSVMQAMLAAQAAKTLLTIKVEVPATAAATTFMSVEMDAYVSCALDSPKDGWQKITFTWQYAGSYTLTTTPTATNIT